jgi:acetyl-CoA synthetase
LEFLFLIFLGGGGNNISYACPKTSYYQIFLLLSICSTINVVTVFFLVFMQVHHVENHCQAEKKEYFKNQNKKSENPLKTEQQYKEIYKESLENNNAFWLEQAGILDWAQFPTVANSSSFGESVVVRWFEDGTLNVCENCVDRHAKKTPNKTAIIFEADTPGKTEHITYKELQSKVCQFAGILQALGVKKGDIVTIYLPMVPEIIYAMLACARIGAVHSVVFSGFSANALALRMIQSKSKIIITAETSTRGGKTIPLKKNVDAAVLEDGVSVEKILVIGEKSKNSLSAPSPSQAPSKIQEYFWEDIAPLAPTNVACVEMPATAPLFVLYTSGATGKPKGVVHSTGGYSVYAALTHKFVFDLKDDDVFFCTADLGWITGHSYGVYGPLANGATIVLFQGVPTYPDASRFWKIIDNHKVTLFYTAPTALRSLSRLGDSFVDSASLDSLRILASVGEPIDPPTWQWFSEKIGKSRCPIMDTWWQTESGGTLICPLIETKGAKPGCASKPFFGVKPVIVPEHNAPGEPGELGEKGSLCIAQSWPGQAIGILNDEEYFKVAYFSAHKGFYTSGDAARADKDGDIWILGRMDDVLNVSGHRLNSAELEQAVTSHNAISEACVVGFPHDIKGQGIFVFAVPRGKIALPNANLCAEIKSSVRSTIGPIATPDIVVLVQDLPKTRSGKIVRRILRKLASQEFDNLGDVTTIANQSCLKVITRIVKEEVGGAK